MTDEERLAEIERRLDNGAPVVLVEDARWLIDRVRALTAERDALLVDRDAWKIRVTG